MLVTDLIGQIQLEMTDDEAIRLYWLVESIGKISGDLVEVGVYKGGSAKIICEAKGEGELHLFDTFEGLPEVDPSIDGGMTKGSYKAELEQVQKNLADYKNVHFYKGLFQAVVWNIDGFSDKRFCLVHLDVDLYVTTVECLLFFYPRMARGGVILSHDYPNTPGIRKAFDDYFEIKPEPILRIAENQCLVVKQ